MRKSLIKAVAMILTVIVLFWIGSYFLSNELGKRISQVETGRYKISSKNADVNLFSGKIRLKEVSIIDSIGGSEIIVPDIYINGFHIFPFLFKQRIILNTLLVENPKILIAKREKEKDETEGEDKSPALSREIEIGKIRISNADLLVTKTENQKQDSVLKINLSVEIQGFSTTKTPKAHTFLSHSFQSIRFSVSNIKYLLPNKLYSIRLQNILYDSEKPDLTVDSITFKSEYKKYEIGKQSGTETDWFDINVNKLQVKSLQLDALLSDTAFVSTEIIIANLDAVAFRDKRLPFPQKPDTKLPMEMVNSFPFGFHNDSLLLENAKIVYEERVDDSNKAGTVNFSEVQAKIFNLSNIENLVKGETKIEVSAKAMNEGVLKADFTMPNRRFQKAYHVSGRLGPMSISAFNPMLRQNASVVATNGTIKLLAFNFGYDNERSNGDLYFEYSDLKVALYNHEDYKNKKIGSLLVNTFVVHRDNLRNEKSFRKGTVGFKRDKKKSIFNYWWKSVLSGIKSTAIL